MSSSDPITFRPRTTASEPLIGSAPSQTTAVARFDRRELDQILNLYGRKVAGGEWRDYAIDFGREKAVFSVFRRSSECPLFTIEKCPKLARKQGAFSVVSANGLILKRGHDLRLVLEILDKRVRLAQH